MPHLTWPTFSRAHAVVTSELAQQGVWDDRLERVTVWLVPFSVRCYGWQKYGSTGDICIPRVSMARIGDHVLKRQRLPLRDVLRHEWAHAIADTHRGLFRSRRFSDVFGGPHQSTKACMPWDPEQHVSTYAATMPGEDFAEVFMLWIKHSGCLPARFRGSDGIRRRWEFIGELASAIGAGVRRW